MVKVLRRRVRDTDSTRGCKVKLIIEVRAGAMDTVIIWQFDDHPPADPDALVWSHRVRRLAVELLLIRRATTAQIQRYLLLVFQRGELRVPEHRIPVSSDIAHLAPALLNQGRLAKHSFEALGLIASRNPEKIFLYSPHNPQGVPPTELQCAGTDRFSLESILLHSYERGVGLDSSWRHLNENFAPLTLITTVTERSRMVPGVFYLSENVQKKTLISFLQSFEDKLVGHADELVEYEKSGGNLNDFLIGGRSPTDRAAILHNAKQLSRSQKWTPAFFMIDKSSAELAALMHVFPGVIIRVCQFHIVQAIGRANFFTEVEDEPQSGKKSKKLAKQQARIAVNYEARKKIVDAFRKVQRYRALGDDRWEDYMKDFEERLDIAGHKHGIDEATPNILTYFHRNWFCDRWRKAVLDEGLPPGQTRDGPWNTNNHIESGFRTLKVVFLELRKNKRIDRLVSILVNEWLLFYRFWAPEKTNIDPDFLRVTRGGHDIWAKGHVLPKHPHLNDDEQHYWIILATSESDGKPGQYEVDFVRPWCNCKYWINTGKMCQHMWACQWRTTNGPPNDFFEELQKDSKSAMGAAEAFVKQLPEPPAGVPGDDLAFEEYLDMATGTIAPSVDELTGNGDAPTTITDDSSSRVSSPVEYPNGSESEIGANSLTSPQSHQDQLSSDNEQELPESPSPSPGLALRQFIPPNDITRNGGRPANLTPLHRGRVYRPPKRDILPVYDHDSPRTKRKRQPSTALRQFRSPTSPKVSGNVFRPPRTAIRSHRSPAESNLSDGQDILPCPISTEETATNNLSLPEELDPFTELLHQFEAGDFTHWMRPGYLMCADELHIICTMVNQLAREISSEVLIVPYFLLSGRLHEHFDEIASKPTDDWYDLVYRTYLRKQAYFVNDEECRYYLRVAYDLRYSLSRVYCVAHETYTSDRDGEGGHWLIYEHSLFDGTIKRIDSLSGTSRTVSWETCSLDVRIQHLFSLMLNTRASSSNLTRPTVEEAYLGTQVFDPGNVSSAVGLGACGFWVGISCIVAALGGLPESLPADPLWVKESLVAFTTEFHSGVLSQSTVRDWMRRHYHDADLYFLIDPTAKDKEIWAHARSFNQPMDDVSLSSSDSSDSEPGGELSATGTFPPTVTSPFRRDDTPIVGEPAEWRPRQFPVFPQSSPTDGSSQVWFSAESRLSEASISDESSLSSLKRVQRSSPEVESAIVVVCDDPPPSNRDPTHHDIVPESSSWDPVVETTPPRAILHYNELFLSLLIEPPAREKALLATRIQEHQAHAPSGKSSRLQARNSEPEFITIPRSTRHKEAAVTLSDFETLTRSNGYVNGTLLNALINLIDLAATTVTPGLPPVAIYNTWFAPKLWQGGYREVSAWSQTRFPAGKGIHSKSCSVETILFLIHEPLDIGAASRSDPNRIGHWTLCAIYPNVKQVSYINSLSGCGSFANCQKLAIKYLQGRAKMEKSRFIQDDWSFSEEEYPQQTNAFDCGVFAICNLIAIALGSGHRMTQEEIPAARISLSHHLFHGVLVPPGNPTSSTDGQHASLSKARYPPALESNLQKQPNVLPGSASSRSPRADVVDLSVRRFMAQLPPLSPAQFSSESPQNTSSDSYESPLQARCSVTDKPVRNEKFLPLKPSLKKTYSEHGRVDGNSYVFRKPQGVTFSTTIDTREYAVDSSSSPVLVAEGYMKTRSGNRIQRAKDT